MKQLVCDIEEIIGEYELIEITLHDIKNTRIVGRSNDKNKLRNMMLECYCNIFNRNMPDKYFRSKESFYKEDRIDETSIEVDVDNMVHIYNGIDVVAKYPNNLYFVFEEYMWGGIEYEKTIIQKDSIESILKILNVLNMEEVSYYWKIIKR